FLAQIDHAIARGEAVQRHLLGGGGDRKKPGGSGAGKKNGDAGRDVVHGWPPWIVVMLLRLRRRRGGSRSSPDRSRAPRAGRRCPARVSARDGRAPRRPCGSGWPAA